MQFGERIKQAMRAERYRFDDQAYRRLRGEYQPFLEFGPNDIFLVCIRIETAISRRSLFLERKVHRHMTIDEMEEIALDALEAA